MSGVQFPTNSTPLARSRRMALVSTRTDASGDTFPGARARATAPLHRDFSPYFYPGYDDLEAAREYPQDRVYPRVDWVHIISAGFKVSIFWLAFGFYDTYSCI